MIEPKYKIGDEVWVVETKSLHSAMVECPTCIKGYLTGRNGIKVECYECNAGGEVYFFKNVHKPVKMYITGYMLDVRKCRIDFDIEERYFLYPNWDDEHSVYTDSNGDFRESVDRIYGNESEAILVAQRLEEKDRENNPKNCT